MEPTRVSLPPVTEIYVYAYLACESVACTWVGLALSKDGKWLAGAVSRESRETVLERCAKMAEQKARTMISGASVVITTRWDDPRVQLAEDLAFAKMP
jgi:hypothetical protein